MILEECLISLKLLLINIIQVKLCNNSTVFSVKKSVRSMVQIKLQWLVQSLILFNVKIFPFSPSKYIGICQKQRGINLRKKQSNSCSKSKISIRTKK